MSDRQGNPGDRPRLVGTRLAFFYGAVFAAFGLHLPYWPVWLEAERGLSPEAIGVLLAALYWPRAVMSLAIARLSDRLGERRRIMVVLAWLTLAGFTLFAVADGFVALFVLSLAVGTTLAGILPLGEATALEAARAAEVDYPRSRLTGSLTFILAASGGGLLIEGWGAGAILPLFLAALLLTALACSLMPGDEPDRRRPAGRSLGSLLKRGPLWPALIAAALIQVSHTVYYGFATIHWRAAGLGVDTIGWLWAEAVIAEVVLFALASRMFGTVAPARLLVVAGLLGALRWTVTALTVDLVALLLVQTLHAATFGLTHLATMRHLQERAPDQLASGQGLFASLLAALYGGLTPLAGWLYGSLAGRAYLVMAALSLAAPVVLTLAVARAGGSRPRS